LSPLRQGRGLATMAVRLAIHMLFEQTKVTQVQAVTDARNVPSVRLLERSGMRRVETYSAVFRDEPCVEYVYSMSRTVT
jgi:RimJ/RimL family protein N-acetyltransferase